MATVFHTGHEINERVCTALTDGFLHDDIATTYGILRGAADWSRKQRTLLWDKGYFKPGHYDGYYRASWTGTQARFEYAGFPGYHDASRFEALGVKLEPWKRKGFHVLVCPPTKPVMGFYDLPQDWAQLTGHHVHRHHPKLLVTIREKGCTIPLEEHLQDCAGVVTFNSGVGWEALRRGIPVVSDPLHSTVGSFLGTSIADLGRSMAHHDRRALFSFMANRQFTLAEIENGTARSYLL